MFLVARLLGWIWHTFKFSQIFVNIKMQKVLVFPGRTHMQDLKDVTQEVHYENYRAERLSQQGGPATPRRTIEAVQYVFTHTRTHARTHVRTYARTHVRTYARARTRTHVPYTRARSLFFLALEFSVVLAVVVIVVVVVTSSRLCSRCGSFCC